VLRLRLFTHLLHVDSKAAQWERTCRGYPGIAFPHELQNFFFSTHSGHVYVQSQVNELICHPFELSIRGLPHPWQRGAFFSLRMRSFSFLASIARRRFFSTHSGHVYFKVVQSICHPRQSSGITLSHSWQRRFSAVSGVCMRFPFFLHGARKSRTIE